MVLTYSIKALSNESGTFPLRTFLISSPVEMWLYLRSFASLKAYVPTFIVIFYFLEIVTFSNSWWSKQKYVFLLSKVEIYNVV